MVKTWPWASVKALIGAKVPSVALQVMSLLGSRLPLPISVAVSVKFPHDSTKKTAGEIDRVGGDKVDVGVGVGVGVSTGVGV